MISKQKPTFLCFLDYVVMSVLPCQKLKANKYDFWISSLIKTNSFLFVFVFFNISFEEFVL